MNIHRNLSLVTLDQEGSRNTCDYWYLIQQNHGPHTAFTRREALLNWLPLLGLELTAPLPEHGQHSWQPLKGEYSTQYHWSYDGFFALKGERTKTLSNGDWTMGIVTIEHDGTRTLHKLNPNCKDRPVYDWRECQAVYK